ncbi:MAG: multicopper oxidase domain-containing protein [Nocardiaceae bacterium]|nr:multicopper oxidase domain-containing protein [Nocardiaceae bacterium]
MGWPAQWRRRPIVNPSRRGFLAGGALLGVIGATIGSRELAGAAQVHEAPILPGMPMDSVDAAAHGGPGFRLGATGVNHEANGFNPTRILRDFDYGKVSTLPSGQTLREWTIDSADKTIEVAPGVRYPAWLWNGRNPGPTMRCTVGDRVRIHYTNRSHHPHTLHFHSIHPSDQDGVPGQGAGLIPPGASTTYEFDAAPFGAHIYHCHAYPLALHVAKGMYGFFIVDPEDERPAADEMIMMQNGWNTTEDGKGNQLYAVNGIPFHYMYNPIQVKRNKLVRIYLANMTEFDPINSFHLHGNFFHHYPTGTSLTPTEYTDTVIQGTGQRGILEVTFPHTGKFMFHAHKTEFSDLGWMGVFEVNA